MPLGHGFIESVPIRSLLAEFHDQPSDLKIGADHCVILGGIALPAGQQALQFLSELPQLPDLPIDPLGLRPIARLMQAPGGLRNLEPASPARGNTAAPLRLSRPSRELVLRPLRTRHSAGNGPMPWPC